MPAVLRRPDVAAGTAPTGSPAVWDVNKNNVSMYATKPQIAAGTASGGGLPDAGYRAAASLAVTFCRTTRTP
jgi:hypothetical protein